MVGKSAFTLRSSGSSLALAIVLCAAGGVASTVNAQTSSIVAHLLFPPRNYEIRLGDTIQPIVRIRNADNVAHTAIRVEYRIRNVVTLIVVYDDSITVPSLAPGDSTDLKLASYPTDPNLLEELGTFDGCLIVGDTICSRLFGVRRTVQPYRDPSNNYSKSIVDQRSSTKIDAPDQTLWISLGAQVVEGDDSTWDPPPPRDLNGGGYGPDTLHSPVIRLDRKDLAGNSYSGNGVGDTLTSFPINLLGQTRANLIFDYFRGSRTHYPLGWDAEVMQGPEPTLLGDSGRVVRPGDSLVLEFKKPGEPALNSTAWDRIAAIDGGHDFEFKSFIARGTPSTWYITLDGITDSITNTPSYFDADFRFRFRLKAKNDAPLSPPPADDADPWYIDNPTLIVPRKPDLSLLWVKVVNPYSKVPMSQATFPVFIKLHEISAGSWSSYSYHVAILDPLGDTVYSQHVSVAPFTDDTILQFPNWDASAEVGNAGKVFIVKAVADGQGFGIFPPDSYSKFYLNVESGDRAVQEFAFDDAGITPQSGAGNDIPTLTKTPGAGIGFSNMSGSFAMKIQLARNDTLYGVRLYFGDANQQGDGIRISLLQGNANSCTPGDTVEQPGVASTFTDVRKGGYFNQFWPYYFPKPMVLPPGTYWLSVSQVANNSMELGGDISRGGGEIVVADNLTPKIQQMYGPALLGAPWFGTQYGSGPADNNGDVSCSFAYETPAGSGNWQPMMPREGLWPVMVSSSQLQPNIMANLSTSLTGAGTYLPMIRPVLTSAVITPRGVTADTRVSSSLSLSSIFPNPFDPSASSTTIAFAVPAPSPVLLTICNIMGDVVKTLVKSTMASGTHSVSWDGRDEHGALVPAGPYLITLISAGHRATVKMIVAD